MKLAQIAKGTRAREPLTFTLLDGQEAACDLRVLSGDDDDKILAAASAHAKKLGGEAKDGDPIFAHALNCEIVALACVDNESSVDKPEPFFASADEVRGALDRDRILLIAEQQRALQDKTSPLKKSLTKEEFFLTVTQLAAVEEGDELPFSKWGRSLLESFTHSMASQYAALALARLPSSPTPSETPDAN